MIATFDRRIRCKHMASDFIFRSMRRLDEESMDVSAVFVLAFAGEFVLAIENERGWDIPGGYLEPGESVLEALLREADEEAGATLTDPVPFGVLSRPDKHQAMVFFACNEFTLGNFVPKADALARDVIAVEDLVKRYHGDRELLSRLLVSARQRLMEIASSKEA
jgi:8-oxo-dGTP pyrophosphatase MutT (NUDIX family)